MEHKFIYNLSQRFKTKHFLYLNRGYGFVIIDFKYTCTVRFRSLVQFVNYGRLLHAIQTLKSLKRFNNELSG